MTKYFTQNKVSALLEISLEENFVTFNLEMNFLNSILLLLVLDTSNPVKTLKGDNLGAILLNKMLALLQCFKNASQRPLILLLTRNLSLNKNFTSKAF